MKREDIVSKLTLEEKALLLTGKNVWETRELPKHGIPSIFLSDGPHGIRKQVDAGDHLGLHGSIPATCFPTAATVANSWDTDLARRVGTALGEEADALSVDVLLGPGLNVKRNPLCGRNFEYFSEDPYLAGKMAAAYIKGIQSNGVAACPKHFAANSQELRRMASNSVVDERTLREIYLTGFEIAVKEGKAKTIMSSYNRVNGTYANENTHLLKEVLRDDWGFDGIVVSDWGASNDHAKGVKAGSNLEMPGAGFSSSKEIICAVKAGRLSIEAVDKAVDELIDLAISLKGRSKHVDRFDSTGHNELAAEAAAGSLVLLKNNENILPLSFDKKIAIVGDMAIEPRYQGAGSSLVNPAMHVVTFSESMKAAGFDVIGVARGYTRDGVIDHNLEKEACELAKKADVVIYCFGLTEVTECEGMDRKDMKLDANQVRLIKLLSDANPDLVGVISGGSSIETSWEGRFKALIHGYLFGQAGFTAVADAISGKVNPSGRLSETYPVSYKDVPFFEEYPAKKKHALYKEGLFVGYRYYTTVGKKVAYPFGYGLSYTTFEYSNLTVSGDGVKFTLRNTGSQDGAEVSQLYVGLKNSRIFRPVRELKGFSKTFLKAGEQKEVFIPFDEYTFRYWDTERNSWQKEGGEYCVRIGRNAEDMALEGCVVIEGTATPSDKRDKLPDYYSGDVTKVTDAEFEELLGRKIPGEKTSRALSMNDPISEFYRAKSLMARLGYRLLNRQIAKNEKKNNPDINIFFILNMPVRAMAKLTSGAIDMNMARGILTIVNGHFFKGVGRVFKGYLRNKKVEKELRKYT